MGAIAAALAREGWRITGSDENVYEPMSGHLQECGIRIISPYHPANVPSDVGLVIVGKRVAASNPELLHVIRRGIPHQSFPQFLREHFLSRSRNAVVAGGAGKTTTTAMLAWILEHAGHNPDYLVGGQVRNLPSPARFAGSQFTVIEGDEYPSCFDDRNPKFVHYQPEVAIITNIIEDHPDIYRNFDELCDAFASLIELVPANGCLILPDHDPAAMRLAEVANCKVVTSGFEAGTTERITDARFLSERSCFSLLGAEFEILLCGRMNVRNAAMAVLAATHFGVNPEQSAAALKVFRGIRNRQEEVEVGKYTVVRDKATHPRALEELALALRQRFAGRRLVSVIQPRATGGRDWIYQRELPAALSNYDKVILTSAYEHNPAQPGLWADDPFCLDLLAAELLKSQVDVTIARSLPEVKESISVEVHEGDVVILTVLEQSESMRVAVETVLRGD